MDRSAANFDQKRHDVSGATVLELLISLAVISLVLALVAGSLRTLPSTDEASLSDVEKLFSLAVSRAIATQSTIQVVLDPSSVEAVGRLVDTSRMHVNFVDFQGKRILGAIGVLPDGTSPLGPIWLSSASGSTVLLLNGKNQ